MSKLVLGTVQFGCRYGINSAGRPDIEAVKEILRAASQGGIATLDTSSAYGNAEEVLGQCLEATGLRFDIVSKYPKGMAGVADVFEQSLKRLGSKELYGYLLHHFDLFLENRRLWHDFLELREKGKVRKIGFSLYNPEELELLLREKVDFDLIQLPRNIFDRRFDPYMEELKSKGVEIHVRSTFLQGLFYMSRTNLPKKLEPLRKYLEELDAYSKENAASITELALGFNIQNPCIDGVLIGVDNASQLRGNLAADTAVKLELDIDVREKELLNPGNWN